jgi:hypothetical protein
MGSYTGANGKEAVKHLFSTAGLGTMLCLAALTAPAVAGAKPHAAAAPVYTYTATIDCGSGPVTVLSTDDLYAPLFDPKAHRSFQPVAWDVVYDGQEIQDTRPGKMPPARQLVDCSYDDGGAAGTVTIVAPRGRGAKA